MYTEIVRLLSAGSLDDEAVREKAAELDAAVTDPEAWLLDYEPEEIRQLVVEMTLGEFFLIGDKIDELHELISDEFAEPLPPFTAGSHIELRLPSGRVRQYSLCNSPGRRYQIAVKPEPGGRGGSMEVHEVLQTGAVVTISSPRNNFELIPADHYVLVAGGIGVTPLLSMAHELWAAGTPFRLHICAQDADAVPFGAELSNLPFAEAITVHLDAAAGRTSLAAASDLGAWQAGTELYLCGPAGFMDWVSDSALGLGWPLDTIHREYFNAPVFDITESRPFDVVLARRGLTLHIPAGRQILDVLEENSIAVPWACSQGVCGTCVTSVLEGEPDHRDAVLSPQERAANCSMCLCVSRAKSEKLVLDL
jgi:vanillate O-demethylase ferredoxin subunit